MFKKVGVLFFCIFAIDYIAKAEEKGVDKKTYYVQNADTPFRSDVSLNAKVQKLKKGEAVLYKGSDPSDPRTWQQVYYQGKLGVIATVNLGRKPPSQEIASYTGASSEKYTTSSVRASASAKGLTEAAKTYATQKSRPDVAAQFFTVELIAKTVKLDDLKAHAKETGLANPEVE